MKSVKGFTLIELMVTIAVLAILVAIAAPAMGRLIESNRVTTDVNRFLGMFELARTVAVQKGTVVRVKELGDKSWVVGIGDPSSCEHKDAIRCFDKPIATNITTDFNAGSVRYNAQGQMQGIQITDPAPKFEIKPKKTELCNSKTSKVIELLPIGRIKVTAGGC